MRVRVKICGLTRAKDARDAVRLGADAIGFVFWPSSPRVISAEDAGAISRELPPFVSRAGIFVDASVEEVRRVVRTVPLDVVQLHGDEDVARYGKVRARIIKAVTLRDGDDVERAATLPDGVMPLVDAADRVKRGGTGREADWTLARALSKRRPIILAGGLSTANVAEAIRHVQPWAVDTSSGVEDRPGIKNVELISAFITAVGAEEREGS